MASKSVKECARILKSLSEDTRLKILKCLFGGEYSVSDIAKIVGKKHSQISHHLGVLKNTGLVVDYKEGKFVVYRINPLLCKETGPGGRNNVLDFECCSIGFQSE